MANQRQKKRPNQRGGRKEYGPIRGGHKEIMANQRGGQKEKGLIGGADEKKKAQSEVDIKKIRLNQRRRYRNKANQRRTKRKRSNQRGGLK